MPDNELPVYMSDEKMGSSSQRGQMRPTHGSRTPPFVLAGLLVVVIILAFNYWSVSSTNRDLNSELDALHLRYRQSDETSKKQEKAYQQEVAELTRQRSEINDKYALLQKSGSDLQISLNSKQQEIEGLNRQVQEITFEKEQAELNLKSARASLVRI